MNNTEIQMYFRVLQNISNTLDMQSFNFGVNIQGSQLFFLP